MRISWQVLLGVALVVLSAAVYAIHFLVFRDPHHIFIYLVGDIAFVFIEVLLVTLVIHRLLGEREKRARIEKLNMVIGAFFSEVGTQLLGSVAGFVPAMDEITHDLMVKGDWSNQLFAAVRRRLGTCACDVEIDRVDLPKLREFLVGKRDFLLRLLENPNLLEHESFTELLQAVFHLTEELERRRKFEDLPGTDLAHIAGDIKRAYGHLVLQWLDYMRHLRDNYPYLFSLAVRTNPFDKTASPIVTT
jgi:hypothetical protein